MTFLPIYYIIVDMADFLQQTKRKTGFTLIELLVSIAIIGLLGAITTINITKIRMKQRDAKRMSDVREIVKALNLYQNQLGKYPTYDGTITGGDTMSQELENGQTIAQTPTDPLPPSSYKYKSDDGTDFTITFCLETDSIQGYSPGCENTVKP